MKAVSLPGEALVLTQTIAGGQRGAGQCSKKKKGIVIKWHEASNRICMALNIPSGEPGARRC